MYSDPPLLLSGPASLGLRPWLVPTPDLLAPTVAGASDTPQDTPLRKVLGAIKPFVNGGFSGMSATCIVQPIDMIKVRIQLAGEGSRVAETNPIRVLRKFLAEEGFFRLYNGLSAALLRQASYTTTRMGLFRVFSNQFKREDGSIPFYGRVAASLSSGAIGSFVGTPFDLALVRMQADQTLPAAERRGYTNAFNALG